MKITAIIVSDSKSKLYDNLTRNTILTLRKSEPELDYEIIVIEAQKHDICSYKEILKEHDLILSQPKPFNYNVCLNKGIKESSSSDLILLLNNDLVFIDGWLTKIINEMEIDSSIVSASPFAQDQINLWKGSNITTPQKGYKIRKYIAGFCIVVKRSVFDVIGELDAPTSFYYSDDAYAEQLKENKLIHAIIPGSYIKHLESVTLKSLNSKKISEYTNKQSILFQHYLKNKLQKNDK